MSRFLIAGLVLLAGAPSFRAADNAKEKSAERWIEQLSDRNFKVRQQAAKAIEALGPEALPALRKARAQADADVRRQIDKWIPEFEASAVVAPKFVTLKLANQPVHKALEELTRQTGYKFQFDARDRRAQKACSLQLEQATFWEAFDKVCRAGKLRMNAQPGFARVDDAQHLEFADTLTPFVVNHRAFRVAAQGFNYQRTSNTSRSVLFEKPAANDGMTNGQNYEHADEQFYLDVSLIAEPRLETLGVGEPSITEALDDQNRSLLPAKQPGMEHMFAHHLLRNHLPRGFQTAMQSVYVRLRAPEKDAKAVKIIRGTIPVYVEKEKKALVVVEDINQAQGKTFELEGLSVQVVLFFKYPKKDRFSLFLITSSKKPHGDASAPMDDDEEFQLQDAKGNAYQANGSSTSGGGDASVERQFSFGGQFPFPIPNAAPLGPPAKLVYVKNISLLYHVPFEFKDLPLH
jgi:hypothetical protein